MLTYISILVFAAVFFLALAVYYVLQVRLSHQQRSTKERLERIEEGEVRGDTASGILREDKLSNIPFLNRLLHRLALGDYLRRLIVQSGAHTNPGTVVLAMLSMAGATFLIVQFVTHSQLLALTLMPVIGSLPYVYLLMKRRRRIMDFEELLPEALDMIVSALRSGFTFELTLKMVAQEVPDPLGYEFAVVFEEQNLGVPLAEVLANLRERVPSDDLDLLIVALVVHRRTGGNLAEVLEKTSSTTRDRFRLKREIRTKTAHGRFSGLVLVLLPLLMIAILLVLNPEYFMLLLTDPAGQYMLTGAVIMQVIGILVIRKIIDIKI